MKSKISKILGIGLTFVLLASLMTFAIPVSADPYPPLAPTLPNMWTGYTPTPDGPPLDAWFYDPDITGVGPVAQSPVDGALYASVQTGAPTDATLGQSAGNSTEWACDVWHNAPHSAYLNYVTGDHAYVELTFLPGITVADLDDIISGTWGFWYYLPTTTGYGPLLELRFTDPVGDGWIDITVNTAEMSPTQNAWTEVPVTTASTATAFGDDPAGTPIIYPGGGTGILSLAAIVADLIIIDAAYGTWLLTRVRVEIGWGAPARDCNIDDVQIDGNCYGFDPAMMFMKSEDEGRTWAASLSPGAYFGGLVVDMVCSSLFEDVLYVTDGNYVYKSVDGGMNFAYVAKDDLEKNLMGDCGIPITCKPITCIDVGYDGSDKPVVFIGTKQITNRVYAAPHPDALDFVVGSVYWIGDESFPAEWHDLELKCYGCCAPEQGGSQTGCYDAYAVGCAPNFATSNKVYVVVTTDDDNCTAAGATPSTRVIYTVGTVCSWLDVSELCWDCDVAKNFEIRHASRIVFPSYYATNPTLFVGVAGMFDSGPGGDVYRVADTFPATPLAIDLNVQGFTSGCIGIYHANICSLDISNDALVAGAYDSFQPLQTGNNVYYSADNGWSWAASLKDPTGGVLTYALFVGGSVLAATSCCDCAVSLDCGAAPAQFFNQISLISMSIDEVLDLSHAPGYLDGSSTMYVLTQDDDACTLVANNQINTSLLRWDGTYWERVFSSFTYDAPAVQFYALMDWVEVSPDFNDTSCVYLANTGFDMYRSLDAGCSWAALTFPCEPKPMISAWIVVDLETVLASGGIEVANYCGTIYRTTYHGAQPWTPFPVPTPAGTAAAGVDFDLSPTIAADNTVLFGDEAGSVYLSTDLGMTWAEIMDTVTPFNGAHNTYVVFDPGYGTAGDPGENTVYAAAGSAIGRCAINSAAPLVMQDWLYLSNRTPGLDDCDPFDLRVASGIDAAGDTALYVSDAGEEAGDPGNYIANGTMAVSYNTPTDSCDLTIAASSSLATFVWIDGTFVEGEPLSIIEYNLYCDEILEGVDTWVKGEILVEGLLNGGLAKILISSSLEPCESCTPQNSAITVISSYLTMTSVPTVAAAGDTGVWRTLNPLALIVEPAPNLVEFEFLNLSAASLLRHPEATGFAGLYPDDLWLTAGGNMLWALDHAFPATVWMWDDVLATPVIQVAPTDGAALVTPTTATLEWEALDAATLYEVNIYSYCPACPTLKNLEYTITTPLTCLPLYPDYPLLSGTTYFWKVRVACDSPQVSKWSDLLSFDTALTSVAVLCSPICGASDIILTTNFSWEAVAGASAYELQIVAASADGTADFTGVDTYTSGVNALASIPGLEYSTVYYWQVRAIKDGVAGAWAVCLFTTMDEPEEPVEPVEPVVIPPIEQIAPLWIWVIIGIGAVLVIVMIVLIVKTRRPA